LGLAAGAALVWALFISVSYEDQLLAHKAEAPTEVRRDYAASVISFEEGQRKHLLVNGIGMTALSPVTKFMVHLPLALHKGKPESALIICFGMGTSYRSALSWGIETTAVELIPSVTKAFGYYHADAARVLNNPKGHIIIDDGRRYLNRTREKFDLIAIDPPPPIEAASSSLLYSKEFYSAAKMRLNSNGIVAAWFPGGDAATFQAVLRAIRESFAYVRCFPSLGKWGTHILASMEPIEGGGGAELAARLPTDAVKDLLEWSLAPTTAGYLEQVLSQETPVENLLDSEANILITDDRPFNEYFLMRRLRRWR
jgi:spermidine synthase